MNNEKQTEEKKLGIELNEIKLEELKTPVNESERKESISVHVNNVSSSLKYTEHYLFSSTKMKRL